MQQINFNANDSPLKNFTTSKGFDDMQNVCVEENKEPRKENIPDFKTSTPARA